MSRARPGKGASLSGAWSGVYSFPRDAGPAVWFSATLIQHDPGMVGTSEEIAERASLSATFQGRRDGSRANWLKLSAVSPFT